MCRPYPARARPVLITPHESSAMPIRTKSRSSGAAVLSALLTLTAAAAPAQAVAPIRTAAQEATAPKFVQLKRGGKIEVGGICIDIMRAIERVEPDIRFVGDQMWLPFARLLASLAAGELDAACGLLRTDQRQAQFDYLDPALMRVDYRLVVRVDDPIQPEQWDDVRKLGLQGRILVIHGYGIATVLERLGGLSIDAGARDASANLDKLVAGRGRFYIDRSPGIETSIARHGLQGKVKLLPTVMHSERLYMVLSKRLDPALREKIRRAIARLDADGELSVLARKWAAPPSP